MKLNEMKDAETMRIISSLLRDKANLTEVMIEDRQDLEDLEKSMKTQLECMAEHASEMKEINNKLLSMERVGY